MANWEGKAFLVRPPTILLVVFEHLFNSSFWKNTEDQSSQKILRFQNPASQTREEVDPTWVPWPFKVSSSRPVEN